MGARSVEKTVTMMAGTPSVLLKNFRRDKREENDLDAIGYSCPQHDLHRLHGLHHHAEPDACPAPSSDVVLVVDI
jgi:hypothetical protein